MPAPASPLDTGSGTGSGTSAAVNTLRFADPMDGYAYDTNPGGAFWATHDGGQTWSEPSFLAGKDLLAFGTGAGYAFALVGTCQATTGCSDMSLERSPVTSDDWAPLDVTFPAGAVPGAGLAVHGPDLWLSLSTNEPKQTLLASTSSGATFTTLTSPCLSGLGGTLQATSADVLWAVCPTGTLAGLMRSTDGGAQWQSLSTGTPLPNSAILAPSSDTSAVLGAGSQELLLTTDGGSSWQNVPNPLTNGFWVWVGFTDSSTGTALSSASSAPAGWPWPNGPLPQQVWRTANGGATWSGPVSVG